MGENIVKGGESVAMITKESQRMQVLRRMQNTRRDETVCLWGLETETILDYINELKGAAEHGSSEVSTAGSKGEIGGNGRG